MKLLQCHFINFNTCSAFAFCIARPTTFKFKFTFESQDGFKTPHSYDILVGSQHNLLFHWSGFQRNGDNHYLEIDATWKEIMPFHDHGVVVL